MNMIVGKRQIVLAALVLCLSIAVYLNWQYSSTDGEFLVTETVQDVKNYGDAQYVSNEAGSEEGVGEDTDAYFAEAKLTRQQSRDESIQTLKNLIESDEVSAEQRTELALKTSELADAIEKEGKIENLIKAKGFEDCMVYYDTERVDVIVKTNGLMQNEVTQMKDIIVKEVTVPAENISIIEVK